MNYKTKKEELQKQFNSNSEQIKSFQQTIQQLAEENLRIQGEFRLITQLEKDENTGTEAKTENK